MNTRTHNIRPRRHSRIKHDVLILILVTVLCAFAVLSAAVWLIAHVLILAGVTLLIGLAFNAGQLHERRRAISSRPGQVHAVAPLPAAVPVTTATVPVASTGTDWDELSTRQPASVPAGSDRDSLLADPRSGARSLWGPS